MTGPASAVTILETLIDGTYTATWNSTALGIMKADDGIPTLEVNVKAQPIAGTDAYGK